MLSTSALLGNVLLALSVVGSPLTIDNAGVNLHFTRSLSLSGMKLPDIDRARATHLTSKANRVELLKTRGADTLPHELHRRASTFDITNVALGGYIANVSVGSPATTYSLIIDTGSSNTWVGAGKSYTPTGSSKGTGQSFSADYGSGSVRGYEYTDRVALSDSLVIDGQSIGVANNSTGFAGVDGVLGIGPPDLTLGTVDNETKVVPTVLENLYAQKKISTEVIGVSFNPFSFANMTNGQLSFGGVDASKYTGTITYVPTTNTFPANMFWGLNMTGVTYGSSGSTVLSSTAGFVDTGTTMIPLATDAYERYQNLTGATFDNATSMLTITNEQYQKLESLYFNIGGTKFELTPNAQIWPRSLNTATGGQPDSIYLMISDIGAPSGKGNDFTLGYGFLERFYSVFDESKSRIGLATTPYTNATTN